MQDQNSDQQDEYVDDQEIIGDEVEGTESHEDEPTEDVEPRGEQKPKSGYVDFNKIEDPELRKQVQDRFNEQYRKARASDKLETELARAKLEIDQLKAPKVVEVAAPDAQLAVDNPNEFIRQQQAHAKYLADKHLEDARAVEYEKKSNDLKEAEFRADLSKYDLNIKRLGVDEKLLGVAANKITSAGTNLEVQNYLLKAKDGPALVAKIGMDEQYLYELARMSPIDAVDYINQVIRPLISSRAKKSDTPPPPTKVNGSRSAGPTQSKGWTIS